jgi:hypothetical protein
MCVANKIAAFQFLSLCELHSVESVGGHKYT